MVALLKILLKIYKQTYTGNVITDEGLYRNVLKVGVFSSISQYLCIALKISL